MPTAKVPYHLVGFVKLHPQVEAVIQHVGRATWDLLLVDVTGLWDRDEFASEEAAEAAGAALGIPVHRDWSDARVARRMNARDQWSTSDGQRRAL
jgi:hypothetical protein